MAMKSMRPLTINSQFFQLGLWYSPTLFRISRYNIRELLALSKEVAYRIIAEQVPIDFSQQQTSGVKVMFRYIAALYVAPPNVSHKIAVTKVEYGEQESKKGFFVTITNSGTRHALINDPVLKISGSLSTITLKDEALNAIDGQNLLAGNVRKFFIPCEDAVPGKNYTGTLTARIE